MIYPRYVLQKVNTSQRSFFTEQPTLKLNALAGLQSAKQSRLKIY
jgi:hypothetical protein